MLEIWFEKTRARMAEQGSMPFRWMRVFRPGIWIAMAVVILVGGRLLWLNASRPAHRQEITDTFGSARLFYGAPQMNRDGSWFTYVATDARGYALFLCDTVKGGRKIVCKQDGIGPLGDAVSIRAWPWSPDDSSFIYSTRGKLIICPADTHLASVELGIGTNAAVSDVIWLNPQEFAWLEGGTICYARKPVDAQWKIQKLPHWGVVSNLTAVDVHTLAWLQKNVIYRLNLAVDLTVTSNPWLDPKMSGLTGFSYSRETGRFLIRRTDHGRDSLWCLDTRADSSGEAFQVMQGQFLTDVQWIGAGKFAYFILNPVHRGLRMADLSGKQDAPLFQQGKIARLRVSPDQKKALFFGTVGKEPATGVWQYEFGSEQLRSIVSGTDFASVYAHSITPFSGSVRLSSGRSIKCVIYTPANFDRHKKYPVVIGNTVYGVALNGHHGRLWAPAIATCGAFVVLVNRDQWFEGIEQWGENVMETYQTLARESCIDTSRVFLFGASAETRYMGEFMARYPGLWKGAILLNPAGLPEFSKSPSFQSRPKILISAGGEEHQDSHLHRYQTNALNFGVLTEIIVHPGETHHVVGNAAQLERTKAMTHFIFEE